MLHLPSVHCILILKPCTLPLRCQEEGTTSVDTQIFYTSFHMIAPHLGPDIASRSGFSVCLLSLVAEFPKDYQDFHVRSSQTGAFASAICDLATAGLGEIHVSSECLLHYYHDVHLSIHFRIHLCF